jgi:hypothetical protein
MTIFDDFADTLINTSFVPFSMRVRPSVSLSGLPQTNQNGYWRLSVTDNSAAADSGRVYMWGVKFISTVGIIKQTGTPGGFSLSHNYPNPFNPSTKMSFSIPEPEHVSLIVYDILGRPMTVMVNQKLDAGRYEAEWNAENYPSGVYFYTLISGNLKNTKKMVLIK